MEGLRIAMLAACPFPAAFASSGLIRELSIELTARGHQVHVVCYHLGVHGFPVDGIQVHRIPRIGIYTKSSSGISFGKPFLDFLLTCELMKLLKSTPVDVIHAHNYEAPLAGFAARFFHKVPVVYHAHNTMVHELPSYWSRTIAQKIALRAGRFLDLQIPRRADHVIVLSSEQKDYLRSCGVRDENMTMIEPAIQAEAFSMKDGSSIRDQFKIGQAPVLIYTGGLQPYQNCVVLPRILKEIHRDIDDVHLLIVARSESTELGRLARNLGVQDFMHFIEGAGLELETRCLAAADVAVIPRLQCIGYPIKILNYMAAGKPVVCFASIAKNFKPDHDLVTVQGQDPCSMADTIVRLLRNESLRRRISECGRERVLRNHHWNSSVQDIEKIYERVLRRPVIRPVETASVPVSPPASCRYHAAESSRCARSASGMIPAGAGYPPDEIYPDPPGHEFPPV